jgi:hypothetical protein
MLRKGVMSSALLIFLCQHAIEERNIDRAVASLHESLAELRPYVEKESPGLLMT